MKKTLLSACVLLVCATSMAQRTSGNPLFEGWYADPEGAVFDNKYWIFPTYSAPYGEQLHFDAFSSYDLVHWEKHPDVLNNKAIKWAWQAMWAPSVVENNGRYYFFFGANDIQNNNQEGGIGVAVADNPAGPYHDLLGRPLVSQIVNGAQPIDQFAFKDADGQWYLIYGGWGHCNICRLAPDFKSILPFDDGTIYREMTPENYVEGPFMLRRNGKYYFMWSEGGWGGPNYSVAYAMADSVFGPWKRVGKILQSDPKVATGAGHHSVIKGKGRDEYYIIYHRRPLGDTGRDHRVTCIDKLQFNKDGSIIPVKITQEGVRKRKL